MIVLCLGLFSCNAQRNKEFHSEQVQIPISQNHIGFTTYDPQIDTVDFTLCDEASIRPYFHHLGVGYQGEKPALVKEIEEQFTPTGVDESGYVTIRFIVNCYGHAGRFRVIQLDADYREKRFSDALVNQLFGITKSLKGWDIYTNEGVSYGYQRYLTFKISGGELIEILP